MAQQKRYIVVTKISVELFLTKAFLYVGWYNLEIPIMIKVSVFRYNSYFVQSVQYVGDPFHQFALNYIFLSIIQSNTFMDLKFDSAKRLKKKQ